MTDTVLSRFVKDFGDYVMQAITLDLYGSDIAKVIIYIGGMIAFFHFAWLLHRGIISKKIVFFFIAWLFCLPVGGKPLAYVLVNDLGVAVQTQLLKTAKRVLKKKDGKNALPPGYVVNAIIRAGSVNITDPSIRTRISVLLENCIPDGVLNKEEKPLSASDLFAVRAASGRVNSSYVENFDPEYLKRAKSGYLGASGNQINCYDLLLGTRSDLKKHLRQKNITNLRDDKGLGLGTSKNLDVPRSTGPVSKAASHIKNTAVNLAAAISLQKEAANKAKIAWDQNPIDNALAYYKNEFASRSVHDNVSKGVEGSNSGLTKFMFGVMSLPTVIAREFKVDKAISNASILHEMNEKMLSLPYMVAAVQNLLKIIAPLAVLTLLLGTFKFFFAWSMMWIATLLLPVVMTFSRGISNSLLYHANKLGEYSNIIKGDPGFLKLGIDFDAANQILADSSRMMNNILNVEMGVWAVVTGMLLATSWFAGNMANGAVAATSAMVTSVYGRQAIDKGGKTVLQKGMAGLKKGRDIVKTSVKMGVNKVPGMGWLGKQAIEKATDIAKDNNPFRGKV